MPDPLELLASDLHHLWGPFMHSPVKENYELAIAMANLIQEDLWPLIQEDVITLYPAMLAYRTDTSPFGPYLRGATAALEAPLRTWPDRFAAEGISFAKALHASYTALDQEEFSVLQRAAVELAHALSVTDHRVLSILPRLELPFFEGTDARTLVRVRAIESSFEDFREFMREMARMLVAGVDDPGFNTEVSRLETQQIAPALQRLYDQVRGVHTLQELLKDVRVDFTSGALATLTLKHDVGEALLGGGITSMAKLLMKLIMNRDDTREAASAVYHFHTGKPTSAWLRGWICW
ncbi:MAG: hypothetical protein NTW28_04670 [Candidatus Solibacter sp.]|nr:hypothetical protein [Candidatus Solibacter sp.]